MKGGERSGPLEALEGRLGHRFSDRGRLEQALRHGSAADPRGSYQRLEFLGDAVLGHAVARMVYERFPGGDEGLLTRMKAYLIRSESLASLAVGLGLDALVQLGRSEESGGGRYRAALLEDVFEAVVGALELDGGWEAADRFVRSVLGPVLEGLDEETLRLADPKSALQEEAQARRLPLPEYRLVRSGTGPDHAPLWVYEVVWNGEPIARGEGPNKRAAQTQAARRALYLLGLARKRG